MKTRSNMPLFVVECEDVKALSNSQIDMLRCGDYLVKKDASGEHAYKVTFKSDTGMCITYHDASVIETQSYDLVDGNWVYNSEDKSGNLIEDVKPIYYHPIKITTSSLELTFAILNQKEEAYANWTECLQALEDLMDLGAYIQCNGAYIGSDYVAELFVMFKSGSVYVIRGTNHKTLAFENIVNIGSVSSVSTFEDGVNKIN